MIEIIFLAILSFFLISKLISILGQTSEDDTNNSIKNISNKSDFVKSIKIALNNAIDTKNQSKIKNLFVKNISKEDLESSINSFLKIKQEDNEFDLNKFLLSAQKIFGFLINSKKEDRKQLLDSRYLEKFESTLKQYKKLTTTDISNISAKISDIYKFANTAFIKVYFLSGKKINESWTFSKDLNKNTKIWLLNDIQTD
jgi:predicted lipid-binding transport protein (Tim44 family)